MTIAEEIVEAGMGGSVMVRDPYALAAAAGERLALDNADEGARLQYGQAVAGLKLLDAARRSLIPWSSRARRFAANMRALEERTADGAALVRAAVGELSRYELHQASDGNFQILDTAASVWQGWLGGNGGRLTPHKATEQLWQYDPQRQPMPAPMLFDGIGFGWLFLHALRATEQAFLNYRCAFYVLERDPLMLAMAMHLHDLQEVIRSPRVRWFVGATDAGVMAALRDGLAEQTTWTLPEVYVRANLRPREWLPIEETVDEIRGDRQKRREAWIAEAAAYYDGKDQAFWNARFSAAFDGKTLAEPLRILGLTSRYTTVLQYSMAELQHAAGAWTSPSGGTAEMRTAIEPDDQSLENPFLEMIATFKPDLVVQISRMRYENGGVPQNVPFLCWDQDSLSCMRTPQATASLNSLTYVAGHGAVFGHTNLNWPRENCIFCHPAGATFRYSDQPVDEAARSRYACDLSYVSNASGTPEALAATLLNRWNHPGGIAMFKEAAAIIRTQSEAGATWDYVSVLNLLKSMGSDTRLAAGQTEELTLNLCTYADRCFRHAALGWVSRWCQAHGKSLRLYGRGWADHPEFSRWAAGSAQPGEEVRAIYQASRINLQMIEPGFIHSRSLDGLAAGGFFLARHTLVDGLNSPEVAGLHELGRWIEANRIADDEELDSVNDADIREKTARARAYFQRHDVFAPLVPSLHVWAHVPPASVMFPQLDAITFRDEQSFGELAGRYLQDADLCATVAKDMQRLVLQNFSYTARWSTFLDAISRGLRPASLLASEMSR
jgi:hypothetical protein